MRASVPSSEPPSGTNETLTSLRDTARMVVAVTRRNSSKGVVSLAIDGPYCGRLVQASTLAARRRQFLAEAALVVLGERAALDLVALVEEGQPEGKADVAVEDLGVLGPRDHGTRRHHGRDVAGNEARAREVGKRHHGRDDLAPVVGVVLRRLG